MSYPRARVKGVFGKGVSEVAFRPCLRCDQVMTLAVHAVLAGEFKHGRDVLRFGFIEQG